MRLAVSAGELIRQVGAAQLKTNLPEFHPGDTVRVTVRVLEGEKERLQAFEGVVVGMRGGGTREMITVRKISFGIGVERMFPLHSPFVSKFELVSRGKARRAKLYYLRDKTGKAARVKRQYMGGEAAAEVTAPPVDAAATADAAAPKAEKKKEAAKTAK